MLTLFKMVQCYIPSTILCGITSREQIEPTSNFTMIHGKQSIAITYRSTTLLNSFNTFLKHIAISSFLQYLLPVHMQADARHIASTSTVSYMTANFEQYNTYTNVHVDALTSL